MKVVCFAGHAGVGKTTLIERVIPAMKAQGLRVSVVKHAHHKLEIDHPGKDTYRHREAGAFEVVAASPERLVLMREFERPAALSVHHLIAELYDGVDWVFVEGFKHSNLMKVELIRTPGDTHQLYPTDPYVVAVVCDDPALLAEPTGRPVLPLNDAAAVALWLVHNGDRFDYDPTMFDE
ncbi:molybdopterin-guanine dinucleotide biosynthesis protein B [Hydrogenophaga sp. PAMC20947]|uniref:molybdopterin-guanine dinucleotide biosynthesis protein B n=1 Tax=Hydrogenophaga sp. PAMC20947 TaxID=2565558 RepID=UPI00109D9D45|nr:molybdopterin-guanine dinucleotide biosynthesis protein B [Hydrogenophaga sp. PAMC20947]QCB45802.1 molybdopterin-guanine dinucleotide biosynthesis protein B [Hydrogenophaga sp. PAMC20947]